MLINTRQTYSAESVQWTPVERMTLSYLYILCHMGKKPQSYSFLHNVIVYKDRANTRMARVVCWKVLFDDNAAQELKMNVLCQDTCVGDIEVFFLYICQYCHMPVR